WFVVEPSHRLKPATHPFGGRERGVESGDRVGATGGGDVRVRDRRRAGHRLVVGSGRPDPVNGDGDRVHAVGLIETVFSVSGPVLHGEGPVAVHFGRGVHGAVAPIDRDREVG